MTTQYQLYTLSLEMQSNHAVKGSGRGIRNENLHAQVLTYGGKKCICKAERRKPKIEKLSDHRNFRAYYTCWHLP
jgi:hypothetical protein